MVKYDQSKPYLKRLAIVADTYEKIQRFGSNNLYPQICDEIAKNSFTLKSRLSVTSDFLNGEGFTDEYVGALVVNGLGLMGGETLNDVLKKVSKDCAKWDTLVLHFNYDLNYRICSIVPVPFNEIRLGLQDENGRVCQYAHSTNWEEDGRRYLKMRSITYYDRFNPDPLAIAQQIQDAGGIDKYNGQLLYLTPEYDQYPVASFDAVLDHAQAQYEAGIYKVSITQNQFSADLAIVFPGEFESPAERDDFTRLIEGRSGVRNAGKRIGLQDKLGTKKASDIFMPLTPANIDKQYEYTESSTRDAILEDEAMPKELSGVRPESGMFNQDNMENSYTYYNARTRNRRDTLSRAFSYILKFWQAPIITNAEITPQQYLRDGQAGMQGLDVRDNLANMTGRQSQNMGRIIRQFAQGKLTYEQAKIMLQGGYGFSNEEIDKLLGVTEDETVTPGPTVTNLGKAIRLGRPEAFEIFGFRSKDWLK